MLYAYDVESRFYRFCEGRSDRGLATIFGKEDSWWGSTQAHQHAHVSQLLGGCV